MTQTNRIENQWFTLKLAESESALWTCSLKSGSREISVFPPAFELDGRQAAAGVSSWSLVSREKLANGTEEYIYEGPLFQRAELTLRAEFRVAEDSPVLRFRYTLLGNGKTKLTKASGRDSLDYLGVSLAGLSEALEVRVSEFLEPVHSFSLSELPLEQGQFDNELSIMGPIVAATDGQTSLLVAYEHGSQVPDAFLHYRLQPNRSMSLSAVKGNYLHGEPLDADRGYETIWFEFALADGNIDALAEQYRRFVLLYMSQNQSSRKPYVFYNTWNYQERSFNWHGKKYLDSMNLERMLAEIDAAHRMGIEVFVLDTGWYEKTGDWVVNQDRFPDGLKQVKAKLEGYGMKLGLWFEPKSAALSSRMLQENRDCVMTWEGKEGEPRQVWETEESHGMCLVSRYADAFAQKLIDLVKEYGVTYFKWDAIGQYGCSDPSHNHGTEAHSERERADNYAFRIGLAMSKIVDTVCAACPEAIVDFDVTEGSRFVGLGFLASGKYFLINNGPYYVNYDLPNPPKYRDNHPEERNWNLFFYPGPARTWICRTPLNYDKWIPSVLFLTHYFPDDPAESQLVNVGSLILGQNGIWGDLLTVSEEGIARIGKALEGYKKIRDDLTLAAQIRTGTVGGNPEIYEKINRENGRGAVVLFASSFGRPFSTKLTGRYTYVTRNRVNSAVTVVGEGVQVRLDDQGRAVIDAVFEEAGAKIVYFGE